MCSEIDDTISQGNRNIDETVGVDAEALEAELAELLSNDEVTEQTSGNFVTGFKSWIWNPFCTKKAKTKNIYEHIHNSYKVKPTISNCYICMTVSTKSFFDLNQASKILLTLIIITYFDAYKP